MFVGYVTLEDTLHAPVLILDSARTPVNLDEVPRVRVYGPLGLVADATVLGEELDSGVITDASNETPIVVTSEGHGLTDGTYITVLGILGNTAANGSWVVTALDADTFELGGSTGNGDYLSGGEWNVAGLYTYEIECTAVNGFEVATTYYALISGLVAGVATADQQTFIVT